MVRHQTWQKMLVFVSMGCGITMEGYIFGHTSNLVAGLCAEKDELQLTDYDISWITSIMFTSMMIGQIMATFITERFGRRLTISLFSFPIIIHWICLYYTRDRNIFLIIRFMVGLCFGGSMPIILMASAEYSSPKIRGTFLATLTSLGPSFGGAIGQIISQASHWRTAAIAAIAPAALSAILPLFCVESPQWLASRGRFEECETAFRALHGDKPSSEKELRLLLEVEKRKYDKSALETQAIVLLLKNLKNAATKKYFWNITLLTLVIQIYKTISGKILGAVLGVTMLQQMTGKSDVLAPTLVVEAFSFVGCALSPLVSKIMNVRAILLSGGIMNNILLIILSVVLYISAVNNVVFAWCNIVFYSLKGLIVNASLFPILEMLPSELYPLQVKAACASIMGVIITLFMFVYIKVIPGLFVQIHYYGVFMLHVGVMSVCLVYLWIKLPETKAKTLQEIELFFKKENFVNIDDILEAENKTSTLLHCPESKILSEEEQ